MREFDFYGKRLNLFHHQEMVNWLQPKVKPNVAVTLTLRQARSEQYGGVTYWIPGDENEYRKTFEHLIQDVSRAVFGRACRRFRMVIPYFATLEGNGAGNGKRFHIHAALHCPSHVDLGEFMKLVRSQWAYSPWWMTDNNIEPITGGWSCYTLKEGSEALLCAGGF